MAVPSRINSALLSLGQRVDRVVNVARGIFLHGWLARPIVGSGCVLGSLLGRAAHALIFLSIWYWDLAPRGSFAVGQGSEAFDLALFFVSGLFLLPLISPDWKRPALLPVAIRDRGKRW